MNFIKFFTMVFMFLSTNQAAFAQSDADGSTTTQQNSDNTNSGGLFVEPALKAETIESTIDYPSPLGSTDTSAKAVGLNARLGFHISDVVFLAADGTYSQFRIEDGDNSNTADGSSYSYGPTLGVQTPFAGIRIMGTYLMGGELNPGSSRGVDLKFKDLEGYRVGLGLRFAIIGISLEFQEARYRTTELEQAGPFSGSSNAVQLKTQGVVAGLSFPIAL